MKDQTLPSIKEKYYYYDIKEEHLPLIRETLDRWALDKRIPINEETLKLGRQKKLEYAIAEKKIEIVNVLPIKEAKEILNSFHNQSNQEILKKIDEQTYNRLFPKIDLLTTNQIFTHTNGTLLKKLGTDNQIQTSEMVVNNSQILNGNLNIPELLAVSNSDFLVYNLYQNTDISLNNLIQTLFSITH